MIVFILMAAFWSEADTPPVKYVRAPAQSFMSYEDCQAAAKKFYYDTTKGMYPWGYRLELDGGLKFSWSCESHVR